MLGKLSFISMTLNRMTFGRMVSLIILRRMSPEYYSVQWFNGTWHIGTQLVKILHSRMTLGKMIQSRMTHGSMTL
jgi:hypothetical protein